MVVSVLIVMALGLGVLYAFLPWSIIGGALQDFAPGTFWTIVSSFDNGLTALGDALADLLSLFGIT